MRLTVLGSAGSHPGPGRACSSYLVETDGYRLLLDCGNGSMTNLLRVSRAQDLDAIILSHRHSDHWADIIGLYYALRYDRGGASNVQVYAPAELPDFIAQLVPGDDAFRDVIRFSSIAAGDSLELGPFSVELFAANHPVETMMSRVSDGERVLAYTADTDATPAVGDVARGADLLVADSTWLESAGSFPRGVHMTGAEAGRQAAGAGVDCLLVTHVWPGFDPQDMVEEARSEFPAPGNIVAAYDGQVLEL